MPQLTVIQIERDAGGVEINRQYTYLDEFERRLVTRVPHPNGGYQWREVQYDARGRLARSSIPCLTSQPTIGCAAGWTEFPQYDLLGRIKRIEQPANEGEITRELVTTIAYSGLARSVTDPFNRTSTTFVDVTGNLLRSTDANGYYQEFSYDSAGSLIEVREKEQPGRSPVLFSAQYEYGIAAFQTSMTDRALGARASWFDGLGQVRRWTDAKGQVFFADYDKLSRLVSQVSPDSARTFVWGNNPSAYNVGQLERQYSVSDGQTYAEDFLYDSFGRLRQQKITLPGETANPYIYDFDYHPATGALDTLTYPTSTSGYRFALKYNQTGGFLRSIVDANSPSTVYWALNPSADPTGGGGVNSLGQVTHDLLGPIVRKRIFDTVTGGLELITAGPSSHATALQNASVNYDDQGNVFQRQNGLGSLSENLTENFEYGEPGTDDIDRLTRITLTNGAGTQTRDLQYDDFGNLQQLTAGSGATPFDLRPIDLSVTWTADNYPKSISAPWLSESVAFAYGPDLQRWRMVYQRGGASETTYYLGLMEKVVSGGGTEYRHYIPGPTDIIGIHSRVGAQSATRYLLSDHLGSLDAIVDSTGSNAQYASFSAFGMPRDPTDWDGAPSSTLESFTRQGFTFQTVLGRMGLNHMNGRVHDAVSGTFLSGDPFIPDAMNTQAFNRYAYVYNNPLTFTDSSGFSPDGDNTCSFSFMFVCFTLPNFLQDYADLFNDRSRDFANCALRGGCRGMWYDLRYNGRYVATQTAVTPVDKKAAAVVASPSGLEDAKSTVGGLGTWGDTIQSLLRGVVDDWARMGAAYGHSQMMRAGQWDTADLLLEAALGDPLLGPIDTPRGHLGYDLAPAAQIIAGGAGSAAARRGRAAAEEAFHYTFSRFVSSIERRGLRAGSYATPNGTLSPLQAHIDLALRPNRGLPDTILRIDLEGLRRAGYQIPAVTRAGRSFGMPGGGYEMQFPYPIPPEFIKVINP